MVLVQAERPLRPDKISASADSKWERILPVDTLCRSNANCVRTNSNQRIEVTKYILVPKNELVPELAVNSTVSLFCRAAVLFALVFGLVLSHKRTLATNIAWFLFGATSLGALLYLPTWAGFAGQYTCLGLRCWAEQPTGSRHTMFCDTLELLKFED